MSRRNARFYIRSLRKRGVLVVGLTVLVVAASWLAISSIEPQYESSVLVLLNPGYSAAVADAFDVDVKRTELDQATVEATLLTRAFSERAIDALELWDDAELSGRPATGSRAPAPPLRAMRRLRTAATDSITRAREMIENLPLFGRESGVVGDLAGGAGSGRTGPAGVVEAGPVGPVDATGAVTEDTTGNADADAEFDASAKRSRERTVSRFLSRLFVRSVPDTDLVRIGYRSGDPERARTIAQSVIEVYAGQVLGERLRIAQMSTGWLEQRLAELDEMLKKAQEEVKIYTSDQELVSVRSRVEQLDEQSLLTINRQLAELRVRRAIVLAELRSVDRQGASVEELLALDRVAGDPLVARATVERDQLLAKLAELRSRYGSDHPRVRDVLASIGSVEAALAFHVDRVVLSVRAEVRRLDRRILDLERQVEEQKSSLRGIAVKRVTLEELEKEVSRINRLRDRFLRGAVASRTSVRPGIDDMRVIDAALAPSAPVYPRPVPMILVVLLLSLLGSLLLALLLEQLDDSVEDIGEIEGEFGYPVLGIVPRARGWRRPGSSKPLSPSRYASRKRAFASALAFIRPMFAGDVRADSSTSVLITSSVPDEGRTTTALNLAWSFGQAGERVVLLEADLRRPSVCRALEIRPSRAGLSEVLRGDESLDDVIIENAAGQGFDVVHAGDLPGEGLDGVAFDEIGGVVRALAARYDRVIIDTPPVLAVADTLILAPDVDAIIFLVRWHRTGKPMIGRALKRLAGVSAPLTGVVLTRVDFRKLAWWGMTDRFIGYVNARGYPEATGRASRRDHERVGGMPNGISSGSGSSSEPTSTASSAARVAARADEAAEVRTDARGGL